MWSIQWKEISFRELFKKCHIVSLWLKNRWALSLIFVMSSFNPLFKCHDLHCKVEIYFSVVPPPDLLAAIGCFQVMGGEQEQEIWQEIL